MAKKLPQCWSCLTTPPTVSLDGGHGLHLCSPCWNKLPILERLKLQLWFRSADDGGLGVRDACTAVADSLGGYTPHGFKLPGIGDN